MGALTIGALDLGAMLIGGMAAGILPKIFGGGRTACAESGITKEAVKAKLEAVKAACDEAMAALES